MRVTRVLNLEQDTPEWHVWRSGLKFSASKAANWTGDSDYADGTPRVAALDMLGRGKPKDFSRNPHVWRGKKYETVVRELINQLTGRHSKPVCAERVDRPYIIASLDSWDMGSNLWEIKCPSLQSYLRVMFSAKKHGTMRAPALYLAQCDHQVLVMKDFEPVNHLVMYLTDGERSKAPHLQNLDQPLVFRRELTPARERRLLDLYDEWYERLQRGELPDPDPSRDIWRPEEAGAEWVLEVSDVARDLHDRIKELNSRLDRVKGDKDAAIDEIVEKMGLFPKGSVDGSNISRFSVRGRVSAKRLAESLLPIGADVDEYLERFKGEASPRTRVTVTDTPLEFIDPFDDSLWGRARDDAEDESAPKKVRPIDEKLKDQLWTPGEDIAEAMSRAMSKAKQFGEQAAALKSQIESLEESYDKAIGTIVSVMGPFKYGEIGSLKVSRYEQRKAVDPAAVAASLLPADADVEAVLDAHRSPPTIQMRLTTPKPKAEKASKLKKAA